MSSTHGTPTYGVMVGPDGRLVPLPGRRSGPWLRPGSPMLSCLLERERTARAQVWHGLWADPEGSWHHVRQLRLEDGTAYVMEAETRIPHGLTRRELEVLSRLVEGMSDAEIAACLTISVKTVGKHVENILGKLRLPSRTRAAYHAVNLGLQLLR